MAIKVIHPKLKRKIEVDIELMLFAAVLIDQLPFLNMKWFALPEAVAEFRNIMENQLDLTTEAASLNRFRDNFVDLHHHGPPKVTFPRPIEGYVTEDVLIESFEEGDEISSYFEADAGTRRSLAKPLVRSFLKMVSTFDRVASMLDGQIRFKFLTFSTPLTVTPTHHPNPLTGLHKQLYPL